MPESKDTSPRRRSELTTALRIVSDGGGCTATPPQSSEELLTHSTLCCTATEGQGGDDLQARRGHQGLFALSTLLLYVERSIPGAIRPPFLQSGGQMVDRLQRVMILKLLGIS
jgi:hypothetical protein